MRKAKEDAKKVLLKAQRESEQIISDLKKARAGAQVKEHELHAMRAQLQGSIDDVSDTIRQKTSDGEAPKDLRPGDLVEIAGVGTKGTVITPPDAKGEALVQAGILKMKIHVSQLRRTQEEKKDRPRTRNTVNVAPKQVSMECDVRGMTVEEALVQVDLFLDGAQMNSLKTVTIIHGKGTGALRAGIHSHLKRHPGVAEFRLGRYGEGEDGVTIVTLK